MPSKRSRFKERERKRRKRAELSTEAKKEDLLKARNRMKKRRETMNDKEKEEFKVKFREGMQKHREKERNESRKKESCIDPLWPPGLKYGETPLYKRDRALQRQKTREWRENQTIQEKNEEKVKRNERMRKRRQNLELKKVENEREKQRKRKVREVQSPEEKEAEKEKKKEHMKQLRERRKMVKEVSDSVSERTASRSPDIVSKMNLQYRNHKYMERREVEAVAEVAGEDDECVCEIDINCEYCQKLTENEKNLDNTVSPEEKKRFEKEDLEQYKAMLKNLRRSRRKEIKEKLIKPLPPLPLRQPSQYEKIREEIIAQRNKEWLIAEKEWEEKMRNK